MNKELQSVKKKFILVSVGLVLLSVFALAFVLYETNTIRFNDQISSDELSTLISDDPAVVEYLEQEKDFEAHFITLANLVKQDQQNNLGDALLFAIIPTVLIVGAIAFMAAKYLLKPVKEAYQSQERFIQDAAHELRNPLAAMTAALQSAQKKIADTSFYKTINRQTKRLVSINEDLLFLEKRKKGDKIKLINISDLLNDVLEDLQPVILEKKIKLTTNIEDSIEKHMDPLDFVKLSRNLVSNAIKYSKNNGKITVSLTRNNGAELIVQDVGIGIPSNELTHIGERFYRAKNVGKISGTGLGFSIVKKVVNSYGGKLDIRSKEGKGTTVTVRF